MSSAGLLLGNRMRLSASPHMQQAVRLLQLSAAEFAQELQTALATNPFLEEVDEPAETVEDEPRAAEDVVAARDERDGGLLPEDAGSPLESASAADDEPAFDAERYGDFAQGAASNGNGSDASEWARVQTNLRTHLLEQICGWGVDARRQIAATIVVESLDDDGYLRSDIGECVAAAGVEPVLSPEEIDQAIRFVQGCDPVGVGARDLAECLALQLDALDGDEPFATLARAIVRDHLEALAHRHYAALRQALACDDATLNAACALIRRLDPRPGHRFTSNSAEYVIPDVLVRPRGSELVAMINPAARPTAKLNQCYVQWFKGTRQQDHAALSHQLQEARWLMHNVEQRFVTIQRVADAILRRQRGFFDSGEIALKPLVLREVAEDLEIHESTVSRATGNKYMDTPRGLFEFRHFFSRSLATETGGACSAAAVRALMTDMIAREEESRPLSDVALAKLLGQNGVRVSRRTVTKYRNLMKVPPVELRRRA